MYELSQKIGEFIKPLLTRFECELYELKFRRDRGLTLVLKIDHPAGVTLDLCEKVSKEVAVHLDVEDLIGQEYNLEVSSPGVDRELRNEQDYLRFKEKRVKVTYKNNENKTSHLTGYIDSFDDGEIRISSDKKITELKRASISKIRLNPIFN